MCSAWPLSRNRSFKIRTALPSCSTKTITENHTGKLAIKLQARLQSPQFYSQFPRDGHLCGKDLIEKADVSDSDRFHDILLFQCTR